MLYVIGVIVYITNIVKGLRMVTAGNYGDPANAVEGQVVIGREDSLRVLAASNTILALVLVGVLVLQAGQWYAERKEEDEDKAFEQEDQTKAANKAEKKEKNGGHVNRSSSNLSKKKA